MKKHAKAETAAAMPMPDQKWMARNDLDTMRKAHEIMADKSRMNAAQSMAKEEMKVMQKIAGKTPATGPGLGLAKH